MRLSSNALLALVLLWAHFSGSEGRNARSNLRGPAASNMGHGETRKLIGGENRRRDSNGENERHGQPGSSERKAAPGTGESDSTLPQARQAQPSGVAADQEQSQAQARQALPPPSSGGEDAEDGDSLHDNTQKAMEERHSLFLEERNARGNGIFLPLGGNNIFGRSVPKTEVDGLPAKSPVERDTSDELNPLGNQRLVS